MSTATITHSFSNFFVNRVRIQRRFVFGVLLLIALIAFETFNYSTTEFALNDFLGNLRFMGITWSTILAIAFCSIDFAGLARLFTPDMSQIEQPKEVWYLFAAWLLAATMNAMLTWWGVSVALIGHQTLGTAVVARKTLLQVVPVFVAVLVWLIRVLIIGAFSTTGSKFFSQGSANTYSKRKADPFPMGRPSVSTSVSPSFPPLSRNKPVNITAKHARIEPVYHPAVPINAASDQISNFDTGTY